MGSEVGRTVPVAPQPWISEGERRGVAELPPLLSFCTFAHAIQMLTELRFLLAALCPVSPHIS